MIREFEYSTIIREAQMLTVISITPPSLEKFLGEFEDLFIEPQFENFKICPFGLQLELKRTNIQTIDECRPGSPSAIGVKALKHCSVLALSPIFGQEKPTQKAPKRTRKKWCVPGSKSLFASMRSSTGLKKRQVDLCLR